MKKIFPDLSLVQCYFAAAIIFIILSSIILTSLGTLFDEKIGLWTFILDTILFIIAFYGFTIFLRSSDKKYDKRLKGKYTYVSFNLNDKNAFSIVTFHFFYLAISFFIPLLGFCLIMLIPLLIILHRRRQENRVKKAEGAKKQVFPAY